MHVALRSLLGALEIVQKTPNLIRGVEYAKDNISRQHFSPRTGRTSRGQQDRNRSGKTVRCQLQLQRQLQ